MLTPNTENDGIPLEILLEILAELLPEDLASALATNKYINQTLKSERGQRLWKKKFSIHFPHLYERLKDQAVEDWSIEFKNAYLKEYQGLSTQQKRLFSIVKEGDIESLKKLSIQDLKDNFLKLSDKNERALRNCVGDQKVFDYLYEQILLEFLNADKLIDLEKKDQHGFTILHWAAFCNQTHELANLIPNDRNIDTVLTQNKNTPLHIAALNGHIEFVTALLEYPQNFDLLNSHVESPIHLAVKSGNIEILNKLIEKGANITNKNTDGDTLLHSAARYGHIELITSSSLSGHLFINSVNKNGRTPLYYACQNGHVEIVDWFLNTKNIATQSEAKRTRYKTPLHIAAENGHTEVIQVLLQSGANINIVDATNEEYTTPLHLASRKGQKDAVTFLLKNKAKVNIGDSSQRTALHYAAENGQEEVAKILIANGANVNAVSSEEPKNQTPLHYAAKNGHANVTKLLLKNGAKANKATRLEKGHEAAIHFAAEKGHAAVIDILIKNGANVNARTSGEKQYQTPLHYAVSNNHFDAVVCLIKNNADVNALDNKQRTPLLLVNQHTNARIISLLADSKNIYRLKLTGYMETRVEEKEYNNALSFRGYTFFKFLNFSKSEKLAAAQALLDVINGQQEPNHLLPHLAVLKNGRLKNIYENACKEFHINHSQNKKPAAFK